MQHTHTHQQMLSASSNKNLLSYQRILAAIFSSCHTTQKKRELLGWLLVLAKQTAAAKRRQTERAQSINWAIFRLSSSSLSLSVCVSVCVLVPLSSRWPCEQVANLRSPTPVEQANLSAEKGSWQRLPSYCCYCYYCCCCCCGSLPRLLIFSLFSFFSCFCCSFSSTGLWLVLLAFWRNSSKKAGICSLNARSVARLSIKDLFFLRKNCTK